MGQSKFFLGKVFPRVRLLHQLIQGLGGQWFSDKSWHGFGCTAGSGATGPKNPGKGAQCAPYLPSNFA